MPVGAPDPVAIGVLGVDGGQSAIRLRHSAGGETVEVEGVSRQETDAGSAVAAAVADAWHKGAFPPAERVVMGLSTAPGTLDESDRLCRLVSEATGALEVWLAEDAVTAHAGALSGCPGVSLVVGTGVACLALRAGGEPRLFGGHGFLLGDEGGGFWIGRQGLAGVLRRHEGRGPETTLTEVARQQHGQLDGLHVRLHDGPRPVHQIAMFAPDVLAAASSGDAVAEGIVDEAVRELQTVVRTAAGWVGGQEVPVALGGRLLRDGELRRRLQAALAAEPALAPREPEGTPLDGAIWLGLSADPKRYGDLVHVWRAEEAA
jgi:glucosamine kinase